MDDTDRLTQQIHELQGSMLAMECFVNSLTEALSSDARVVVQAFYASESTAFRAALMASTAPEATVAAFERDVQRALNLLGEPARQRERRLTPAPRGAASADAGAVLPGPLRLVERLVGALERILDPLGHAGSR